MSAALVKKSLIIVDLDFNKFQGKKGREKKARNIIDLIPQNQKIIKKVKKGRKVERVDVLKTTPKLTVIEVKQKFKSENQKLKENLRKLKLIREASNIQLDKHLTKQIFERARTRRPIKTHTNRNKNNKKTAFTEEDFKKFEVEYFDE